MSILDDQLVRNQLRLAWEESRPGTSEAHEEGGFVLRDSHGTIVVERWQRGLQNEIVVPEHAAGIRNSFRIVATFHTHPNPAPDFQQEPSLTDIRAVRDDPDLHHAEYDGEYVISREWIYRIGPDGSVEQIGITEELLK